MSVDPSKIEAVVNWPRQRLPCTTGPTSSPETAFGWVFNSKIKIFNLPIRVKI